MLWCCESWLITQPEKRLLKTTLHAMLRRIAGPRRRPLEDWLDWIKRSTRQAVAAARKLGIRLWHEAHLRVKWNWAGHVLRMSPDRLARRATVWRDSSWQATEMLLPASLRIPDEIPPATVIRTLINHCCSQVWIISLISLPSLFG